MIYYGYMKPIFTLSISARRYHIWLALGLALIASSMLTQLKAQNIKVETLCGGRLSITWESPPGAGGYLFQPQGDEGAGVKCSESESKCVVGGLKSGKSYGYWLDRVTRSGIQLGPEIRLKGPNHADCPEYIAVTPTPRPPADTCAHLPAYITVRGFQPFSTQCQQVSPASVGNARLMAEGIIDAVDIWGNVGDEMQVCFQRRGRLYFLDASTSPRMVSDLPEERIDGMTCGRINRAGTVALLPDGVAEAPAPEPQPDDPPAIYVPPGEAPYICQLIAGDILNLRQRGDLTAEILAEIPAYTLLVPQNRTEDWFKVGFEESVGWVNKAYVFQSVGCKAFNAVGDAPPPPVAQAESAPNSYQTETDQPIDAAQICTLRTLDILNLRAGPSLMQDILAEIPYETDLQRLNHLANWFQVAYAGMTGWVHSDYVRRSGACG